MMRAERRSSCVFRDSSGSQWSHSEVVAICDLDRELAEARAAEFDIPWCSKTQPR